MPNEDLFLSLCHLLCFPYLGEGLGCGILSIASLDADVWRHLLGSPRCCQWSGNQAGKGVGISPSISEFPQFTSVFSASFLLSSSLESFRVSFSRE